jgi:hypothetical protein
MDEIEAVFNRKDMTFEEAVKYFKERVPVSASVFYRIAEKYRGLAFTVGGYTKAQILKRFYDEILAALEDGNTLSEFRSRMNEFLTSEGYEGLDPLQADLIFRTNIQTAYNVGHYEQMTDPGVMKLRPLLAVRRRQRRPHTTEPPRDGRQGIPSGQRRVGLLVPSERVPVPMHRQDPIKAAGRSRGLKVEQSAPGGVMPDPHFSTNPAKVRFTPDLKDYPEALVKAYQKREKENPSL